MTRVRQIKPMGKLILLLATAFTIASCATVNESILRPVQVEVRVLSATRKSADHIFYALDHRAHDYSDISSVEAAQEIKFAVQNFDDPRVKSRLGANGGSYSSFTQIVSSVGGLVPLNSIREIGSEKLSLQTRSEVYSSMDNELAFSLSGTFSVNGAELVPVFRNDCGTDCAQEDEWLPLPRTVMSVDLENFNAAVRLRCGFVFRYIVCDMPEGAYGYWVRESISGKTLSEILVVDAEKVPLEICPDVRLLSTKATSEPDNAQKIQLCFTKLRNEALK